MPGWASTARADEVAVRIGDELWELLLHRAAEEQTRRTPELLKPFAKLDGAAGYAYCAAQNVCD